MPRARRKGSWNSHPPRGADPVDRRRVRHRVSEHQPSGTLCWHSGLAKRLWRSHLWSRGVWTSLPVCKTGAETAPRPAGSPVGPPIYPTWTPQPGHGHHHDCRRRHLRRHHQRGGHLDAVPSLRASRRLALPAAGCDPEEQGAAGQEHREDGRRKAPHTGRPVPPALGARGPRGLRRRPGGIPRRNAGARTRPVGRPAPVFAGRRAGRRHRPNRAARRRRIGGIHGWPCVRGTGGAIARPPSRGIRRSIDRRGPHPGTAGATPRQGRRMAPAIHRGPRSRGGASALRGRATGEARRGRTAPGGAPSPGTGRHRRGVDQRLPAGRDRADRRRALGSRRPRAGFTWRSARRSIAPCATCCSTSGCWPSWW